MDSAHDTRLATGGLPHSEILGSQPARGSPRLIAACHVLPRLLAPRHPPDALLSLDPPATSAPHDVDDVAGTPPAGARHLQEGPPAGEIKATTRTTTSFSDRSVVEHDGTMLIPMPNGPHPRDGKTKKRVPGRNLPAPVHGTTHQEPPARRPEAPMPHERASHHHHTMCKEQPPRPRPPAGRRGGAEQEVLIEPEDPFEQGRLGARPRATTTRHPLAGPKRAWWAWADLNGRPHAYQACALTS
jgi:hypothetical protein